MKRETRNHSFMKNSNIIMLVVYILVYKDIIKYSKIDGPPRPKVAPSLVVTRSRPLSTSLHARPEHRFKKPGSKIFGNPFS